MKRYLLLLFVVSVCFTGCNKFLNPKPDDFVSPVNFYRTENDLEIALAGIYDRLQDERLYGNALLTYFILSDEMFIRGSSSGLMVGDLSSGTIELSRMWESLYAGINRANLLLDNIGYAEVDEQVRLRIEGEARFLRAYYYFLLVDNFGSVPIRLEATKSAAEPNLPGSPIADIYDIIVSDMKIAEEYVSEISDFGYSGRISKSAVRGVLARVFLTMAGSPLNDVSKFQEAREYAWKVINSGEHELNKSFSQVFINYCQDLYDVRESIWEVEFQGNSTSNIKEAGRVGGVNGITCTDMNIGYAQGLVSSTGILYSAFDDADLRKNWTIAPYRYVGPVPTFWDYNQIYDRNSGKWRREYETYLPKSTSYTPINFPLLRYSDVILMYAEADNEINGPKAETIDLVNQVRRRAWGFLDNGPGIKAIAIFNGGSEYVIAPEVIVSGGGGTGAKAVAVVSDGTISEIHVTDCGSGYSSSPMVSFLGETGSGAVAIAEIAQLSDVDLANSQTSSPTDFREAIRNERFLELAFEGFRRHDLVRWGIYSSTMAAAEAYVKATAPSGFQYAANAPSFMKAERAVLFPIPESELTVNKLIAQNPGW